MKIIAISNQKGGCGELVEPSPIRHRPGGIRVSNRASEEVPESIPDDTQPLIRRDSFKKHSIFRFLSKGR